MKKIFFLSVVAALFLCSACSGMNDKLANGSMSFETTEFPNQNSSGNENLPGNTHYFEITVTNVTTKAQQVFYMNQNEKQFIELEPGKYSVYILGQTDDCEYEWQSDDKNPIVVKKNEITAVSAKMWEKDPEFWFEQENNKYIPNNDDIAPAYSGKIEKNQIFAFWVNQDDAKETVKAGEKISGKISKKFIPHIITPEPLILNFKQTENEVLQSIIKFYLDYSCSSDCQIKYLLNPETIPEDESAFANAPVYNPTSGIDFPSTSDMLTVYAIALPTEGDILHTASEIAIVEYKKCYGTNVNFELPEFIYLNDGDLNLSYNNYLVKNNELMKNYTINNANDYVSYQWFADGELKSTENFYNCALNFVELLDHLDIEYLSDYSYVICKAYRKDGRCDKVAYRESFTLVDLTKSNDYFIWVDEYDDESDFYIEEYDPYNSYIDLDNASFIWFTEEKIVSNSRGIIISNDDLEDNQRIYCFIFDMDTVYVCFNDYSAGL